jgi:GGDEF domain-containing protein
MATTLGGYEFVDDAAETNSASAVLGAYEFVDDLSDEVAAAPVVVEQPKEITNIKKANDEFLDETTSMENFSNSVKQGWLGLKSTIEYLKRAPLIEKGTQAKAGDHIIGYDPTGNPILSSQAYTSKQQERVNKSVSDIGDIAAEDYALSVAPLQAEMANIPKRPATEAMLKAKGVGDMFDAFAIDPLGIMSDIGVSSMVQQIPALALTIATRKPAVAALAAGGNSYANELAGGVTDYLSKSGVDIRDPQQIVAALKDQKTADAALSYASRGALPVAALDTLSGGLAGKTFIPEMVMKKGLAKDVASTFITQPIVQGAMGATGETGKQFAQTGEISAPGEIFAEAIGEFSSAPVEAGSMAYERIAERNRFDQHNTPAGVLFNPTHVSNGVDVQQATKAGQIVSGVYVDKAGKVFKDMEAVAKPVTPGSFVGPESAEAQAEKIKAEVMLGLPAPLITVGKDGVAATQATREQLAAKEAADREVLGRGDPAAIARDKALTARRNQSEVAAADLVTRGTIVNPVSANAQQPVENNMPVYAAEQGAALQAETGPVTGPAKGLIASQIEPQSAHEQPVSKTDKLIEQRNYLQGLLDNDAPPSAVRDAMQIEVHNIDRQLKGNEPAEKTIPKNQFDPNRDDFAEFIRQSGGIDTDLESDWSGRFKHLNTKGKKNIEQPGKGLTLGALTEKAMELGFIENNDQAEFEKLLDAVQSGTPIYSRAANSGKSKQARESMKEQMGRLKVDKEAAARKIEEDSKSAFDEEYSKLLDGTRFERIVGPNGETAPKVPPSMGRREDGRPETRRKNQSAREYYKSLSNDELLDIVLKHDLTGIKGRRAFVIEQKQAEHFVSVDADSLKWVNDNMSPDNGDKLLQTVGTALVAEFGYDNVYHISGDEFYVLGFDNADDILLKQGMGKVEAELGKQIITAEKPDGTKIELKGIAATPGYGTNKKEADSELKSTKQSREDEGKRAPRGEAPASAVITVAEGQQNPERSRAEADARTGIAGREAPVGQAESVKKSPFKKAEEPTDQTDDDLAARVKALQAQNEVAAQAAAAPRAKQADQTPLYLRIPEGTQITVDGRIHKNARQAMQIVEEKISAYEQLIKCMGG